MSNKAYEARRRREKRAYDEFAKGDLSIALNYFDNKCAYCSAVLDVVNRKQDNGLELDHYHSLSTQESEADDYLILQGFTLENTLPTCRRCNRRKNNANPEEWLTKQFGSTKAQELIYQIDFYFATVTGDD